MRIPTLAALAALICSGGSIAAADPAAARKLNSEGMRHYKSREYWKALELFRKAIAEDPSLVLAHYNAASMASLTRDNKVVIAELEWLAASKDPAAAKALAGAAADRDLELASMHPRVRELIGLPAVDKAAPPEVLLERGGVWGADGSFCGGTAFTLTLRKGGAMAVDTQWGCNATDHDEHEAGTWAVTGGAIVLKSRTIFKGGRPASFGPCDEDAAHGWCLNVSVDNAEMSADLNMHRGAGTMH